MPLNKAKGRMFQSVGWTWNPITGCTHGCPYCWAKSLADRWGKPFHPQFREHFLKDQMPNDGTWIFVGSTGDIMCDGMKDEWVLKIIQFIYENKSDNKFLLITKDTIGFLAFGLELEKIKDKVILGTTIETNRETGWSTAPLSTKRAEQLALMKDNGFTTFLSLEPLADFDVDKLTYMIIAIDPEAIEIGLENYTEFLPKPPEDKILELLDNIEGMGIPYMLKENLRHLGETANDTK